MTEAYYDSYDNVPAIANVHGIPKEIGSTARDPRVISRWGHLWRFLSPRLYEGENLGTEYLRGKATQQTAQASKTLQEAGMLAAQREKLEMEAESVRLDNHAKFIANLKEMRSLPPTLQELAFAKMMENDPRLREQVEKLVYMAQQLKLEKGFVMQEFLYSDHLETNDSAASEEI